MSNPVNRRDLDAYRYKLARVFSSLRVVGLTFIAVFYTITRKLLLLFIAINGFAASHVIDYGPLPVM